MKISRSTVLMVIALMATGLVGNANALVYSISKGGLAQAILATNASPEIDVIELEAGLYALSKSYPGKEGFAALPTISGKVVIRGGNVELHACSQHDVLGTASCPLASSVSIEQ